MVCSRNETVLEAVDTFMKCPGWVSKWVHRFEKDGLDGFRDLPRCSRSMQTRHWEASSDYTQALHQAPKLSNMTAWNAESCLTEAV